MGMFDKDKEIGTIITNMVKMGEPFILHGARIKREDYPTDLGPAVQTELRMAKMDAPTEHFVCTTLASSIATKVREAEPGDFPAVVMLNKVQSKTYAGTEALVIQFLKPYTPPTPAPSFEAQAQTLPAESTVPQTDDIPF